MKERPILFSAPMVRALLAGTKTQTRRIIKRHPPPGTRPLYDVAIDKTGARAGTAVWWVDEAGEHDGATLCPYGMPGDRLWVREAFSGPRELADLPPREWGASNPLWFWADGNPTAGDWTRPKPSIHMPRRLSRITLEIADVLVERLQEITHGDLEAEGIPCPGAPRPTLEQRAEHCVAYSSLWESLNGRGSWDANPWVWVVSLRHLIP